MSTVLWVNVLKDGKVMTEDSDKYALFKYADKLDELSRKLNLGSFDALCDDTDLRFNMQDMELPEGMGSTNEMMAKDGKWVELGQAIKMLEGLLAHIRQNKVRFGLLKNEHVEVVAELEEAMTYAKSILGPGVKFNFSIVM